MNESPRIDAYKLTQNRTALRAVVAFFNQVFWVEADQMTNRDKRPWELSWDELPPEIKAVIGTESAWKALLSCVEDEEDND